jgi:hypothetical protein
MDFQITVGIGILDLLRTIKKKGGNLITKESHP